ncbi:alpha-1,2-fucosyltransferase [Prochlorococcus sp. MIT 1341]|uniref:alpha-1,2-fucosyltransferase n=1 Tax=Prochlorococcus sp. MIT 1341 TaxID=3096221 RepID=UPI002A753F95|nr:alpha-1,2-fucosyltransferase [Prochlorococcus sp. MIT 1341]
MIGIRLIGGLGNQLFQYAAAKALANRLNVELLIDTRSYTLNEIDNPLNAYLLDRLRVTSKLANEKVLKRRPLFMRKPSKYLQKFGIYKLWYREKSFNYDRNVETLPDKIFLDGYFQSEKYFKSISKIIRMEYLPVRPLSDRNQQIANQARRLNSVMLHVRRGDYASNSKILSVHGLCSLSYYTNSINFLKELVNNPHFFVFSDDPFWAKSNLPLSDNVTYIDGNLANPEIDLHLMSFCKHHIIANSTFSWWAAWLANFPGKIVVAPSPWFDSVIDKTPDLIPASWNIIGK